MGELSSSFVYVCSAAADKPFRYKLMDLKQLSFKTEDPNMVTFHFKKEGMTEFKTHTASVTPTQKAQCVAAVKSASSSDSSLRYL